MEFTCYECKASFLTGIEYFNHVKYCQSNKSIYQCGQINCNRQYSSFESFRKHFRLKHQKAAQLMSIDSIPNINEDSNSAPHNFDPEIDSVIADNDDVLMNVDGPEPDDFLDKDMNISIETEENRLVNER